MARPRGATASIWVMCVACTPTDSGSGTTTGTPATSESTAVASDTTSESTTAADESSSSTESTTGGTDGTSGGATCPFVENAYSVAYDPTAGNTCDEILGRTNTCSVTQTDCELKWFCNGALEDLLPQGPIDADGVFVGEGTYMGTPVVCTVTFAVDALEFEFDCSGRDLECTGGGF